MLAATYDAAVVLLPGWSDAQIMECDLARLIRAIMAAQRDRRERDRFQARLHGQEIEEEVPEQSDEEMTASLREALQSLKRRDRSKGVGLD